MGPIVLLIRWDLNDPRAPAGLMVSNVNFVIYFIGQTHVIFVSKPSGFVIHPRIASSSSVCRNVTVGPSLRAVAETGWRPSESGIPSPHADVYQTSDLPRRSHLRTFTFPYFSQSYLLRYDVCHEDIRPWHMSGMMIQWNICTITPHK